MLLFVIQFWYIVLLGKDSYLIERKDALHFFQMLLEHHICIKFCYKVGRTGKETYDLWKSCIQWWGIKGSNGKNILKVVMNCGKMTIILATCSHC